ncbi:MAG: hypothetical protein ACRDPA_04850, partial [Solirubrobacteraceae bacterium]
PARHRARPRHTEAGDRGHHCLVRQLATRSAGRVATDYKDQLRAARSPTRPAAIKPRGLR